MKVGFIGLGKLGLSCAEVMQKAYDVTGYDIYPRSSTQIKISDSLRGAVVNKDIIFVAVQTPHDPAYDGSQPITHLPNKDFDYTIVKDVLKQIDVWAHPDQLIVLIRTVLPGTVRRELRECSTIPRFIYNPYLIAMGSVEWDMVNPEMIIIGTEDGSKTGDAHLLTDFYKPLMQNNPRYVVGTWDEAESIKIFYNTFISTKIALVNMIQDVAMKNGNINVDVVTDALSASTTRIMSSKYMTAGMGDAGACHPRDNIALRWLAQEYDIGYDMFDTIMHAREVQAKNLADFLVKHSRENNLPIIIHGKAYKPDVPYCIGSYSTLVGHYVKQAGCSVKYVDPLADDQTDVVVDVAGPAVILMAHNRKITYGYTGDSGVDTEYFKFKYGSVIIDPWRRMPMIPQMKVIHYGNTRQG